MSRPTEMLRRAVRRVEQAETLDIPARVVQDKVERATEPNAVKRVLSGEPVGHRLHPLLTDVTIGCWTSATLVDFVAPGSGAAAARRLTGIGILSAIPTAITGLSDWADTYGEARRVGFVHLSANTVALGLECRSWWARRRGRHVQGALFGLAAIGAASVAGYLGGHLVYVQRVGVDADVPLVDDEDWHVARNTNDIEADNEPVGVTVEGARVVLVRRGGFVYALAATCTHAGGPLDEGEVRGNVIVCPWHHSEFCLDDGAVARGPATTPEPVYETRLRGEVIEVRRADPDRVTRVAAVDLTAANA